MDQFIQYILSLDPFAVFLALMLFACCPISCIILINKINRWVKTVTVLVCGELSAIALFVLAQAAKTAGMDSILANCMPLAVIWAIFVLVAAIAGHVVNWKRKTLEELMKKSDA